MERILNMVIDARKEGKNVIIRSLKEGTTVADTIELGKTFNLTIAEVSEVISAFLGQIVKYLIGKVALKGIVLTGGETAIKTARCLGINGFILKDEILPGVPYGHFLHEE